VNAEFAPLFKLSKAERLQLVEDLWDSIAEDGPSEPISDEVRDEILRRREALLRNPSSGRTWEQVKARARAQHG